MSEQSPSTELVQFVSNSGLPEAKSKTIIESLGRFFGKIEEWRTQAETIKVTSPEQSDLMVLARTGRLQLKNMRLEAEKIVKNNRAVVQSRMADDKLEDTLWLKAGQMMEAGFKHLEAKLEDQEKFAERWEAEQKQKRYEERMGKLTPYGAVEVPGLADMTDNQFDLYLSAVARKYEEDEKARIEAEEKQRKDNLHNERKSRLARYADFIPGFDGLYFGDVSEEDFIKVGTDAKAKKDAYDAEQEQIRKQAEADRKAREEAEKKAREAQLEAERKAQEAKAKAEAEARKAQAEAEAKIRAEREAREKAEQEALRKQQEAEAEAKRLRDAEEARIKAEADAKAKAEQDALELAQKSDKERLKAWVESFELPAIPGGGYTDAGYRNMQEIQAKFEAFKKWAKKQLSGSNPV